MENSIPPELYVINEKLKVSCRLYRGSSYLYYCINGFFIYSHEIKCDFGLRFTVCQIVLNKIASESELEGFLNLTIETINTWLDEYRVNGSKSFRKPVKSEILFLTDENIRYLQKIVDKNISLGEIDYLQNIDYKLIHDAFKEQKILPFEINRNIKISNNNKKGRKRINEPKNLIYRTTIKPKIANKVYL
jgi:predicted DNA-binding protein YlxM (UPF0122 family)